MNPKRTPVAAGNWKMHLTQHEARELALGLHEADSVRILLFPSFTLLATVSQALENSSIEIGGQDLHPAAQGAHTGDTSGAQLRDAGCRWVLVGHSERRHHHGETDDLLVKKIQAAVRDGLKVVYCLGETAEEREVDQTLQVLDRQLLSALPYLPEDSILAYEPVWAIGTGLTATPELAEKVHAWLRNRLGEKTSPERAEATSILYGGSVKPENAASLLTMDNIDGFLVGGASLDSGKFCGIIGACADSSE